MLSPRRASRWIDRSLLRVEATLVGGGILGIAGLGIANVCARNLLGGSLASAEELAQALMVWITFAGLGLGARRARHIRMSAFYDQLPDPVRKRAWLVICAGTSALLLTLAVLALRYVASSRAIGGVTPALGLPLWWVYGVAPIGLALGALEYALAFVRNLMTPGIHESLVVEETRVEPPA